LIRLGLNIDLPADFAIDQAMLSFRAPAAVVGDPRVLRRQTVIRPSLMLHRRDVGDTALEVLAGEVTAELLASIPGLTALTTETIAFVDGHDGVVVGFDFGAPEVGTARQFHALRKDGTLLTTVTLTLDKLQLNDAAKQKWWAMLASTTPDASGEMT
jgi:hypothetical protein